MSPLSRLEVRREITKLNRLDANQASYPAILATYGKLTEQMSVVVGIAGAGELFYRVRRTNDRKPLLLADLQAPPAERVTGFQRCNPPGVPMFYAASKRVGALLESRVKAGDVVCLSQWIGRRGIPVNRVFEGEEHQIIPGVDRSTIHGPNDDLLLTYLDTQFTRRIHETFSDDYKFTSAIAQILSKGFQPNRHQDIHEDGYVALKYPSVRGFDLFHNTAMHAGFAEKRLELLHVMELRVTDVKERDVSVEILDTAIEFNDGRLGWTGNANLLPQMLDRSRAVPFVFNGTAWQVQSVSSDITQAYIRKLMVD